MNKLITVSALLALTACNNSLTHPAASHDCTSMHLQPGTAAYDDCMNRMGSEEKPLSNEQGRPY